MGIDPFFRRCRMSRIAFVAGALAALLAPVVAQAQAKPLKIGYYTGGGSHDYKGQAKYLPTELEKQINATVEIKWEREALRDPELGKGFDVVIYNICWADDKKDEDLVEKVPKVTFEGKPTVFLHCALHCFRWSENAWTESMGMTSRSTPDLQGPPGRVEDPGRRAVRHPEDVAEREVAPDRQEPSEREDQHGRLGQPVRQGEGFRHDAGPRHEDDAAPGVRQARRQRNPLGRGQAGRGREAEGRVRQVTSVRETGCHHGTPPSSKAAFFFSAVSRVERGLTGQGGLDGVEGPGRGREVCWF
jgi:hypothetical protein